MDATMELDMEHFRQRLLQVQTRLLQHGEDFDHERAREEELSFDLEDVPTDLAAELLERGREATVEEMIEEFLERIQRALEKIEEGTYGLCEDCGRPIPQARLEALPYAERCVECQSRIEVF
ncbi:MAG TPA: conjugal transfer protein TraR [Armatimonadetes bacterium]|nr:conjugal transfer protein TraR [Armatimonadota bacterium]